MNTNCTNCGKKLHTKRIVWLELDQDTGNYYANGIPKEHTSQGMFPFGADCAKKVGR